MDDPIVEVDFKNIVLGTCIQTDCEGKLTFNSRQDFQLQFNISAKGPLLLRISISDVRRFTKSYDEDNMYIALILRPPSIKRIGEILAAKDFIFQISNNSDENRFQIYFDSNKVNSQDIYYMDNFFSSINADETKDKTVIDITSSQEESPKKQSLAHQNLTLFKNQKKKHSKDEEQDDYVPIKRQRKNSNTVNSVEVEPKEYPRRACRSRNRDEVNLCEDMSEEAQLQEALKRSLKGVDQSIIDSITELNPEEPVDLYENVDKTIELFTYPTSHGDLIVRMEDYICLSKNEYLSDVIIDFYLHYTYNMKMTQEQRDKTYIFQPHFYTLYACSSEYSGWNDEENAGLNAKEKRYRRVMNLIKDDVNIFDKDYLIFPLLDHNHWFLAIVCHPKLNGSFTIDGNEKVDPEDVKRGNKKPQPPIKSSCILIFDSIKGNGSRRTVAINHIKNFLDSEWTQKYQNTTDFILDVKNILGHSPKVPLQLNNVDCGCFMLEFVEKFFETPIEDYRQPIDLTQWFSPESVRSGKRREIACVIESMMENTEIELPSLQYFGDSQPSRSDEILILDPASQLNGTNADQNGNNGCDENGNNENNNDENFNNNNDFNCPDINNMQPQQAVVSEPIIQDEAVNDDQDMKEVMNIPLKVPENIAKINSNDLMEVHQDIFVDNDDKTDSMPEINGNAKEDEKKCDMNEDVFSETETDRMSVSEPMDQDDEPILDQINVSPWNSQNIATEPVIVLSD